jgi:hypothetical protein
MYPYTAGQTRIESALFDDWESYPDERFRNYLRPATGERLTRETFAQYHSGPCAIDAAAGSVTLTGEAAWRPDYVGTEQKRFFRFDNGRLIVGPAPNSVRGTGETLTRRLTLERQ